LAVLTSALAENVKQLADDTTSVPRQVSNIYQYSIKNFHTLNELLRMQEDLKGQGSKLEQVNTLQMEEVNKFRLQYEEILIKINYIVFNIEKNETNILKNK
jgi:uncharacterized protein YigA (DUF484 family)